MLIGKNKTIAAGAIICLILSQIPCFAAYEATKVTYTISGSVGISGVVMNGLPGNPVTDNKGNYNTAVEYGWGGTVTPTKEGYTFEPAYTSYKSVTANQTNQSYNATLLTFLVSGSVGVGGAVMNGLPGQPVTDREGIYSVSVPYNWTGSVTPTKEGYIFNPANRKYDNVARTETNQNYTASMLTFTVSGIVTFAGGPMEGVLISAGEVTSTTDIEGKYTITVNYGWSGVITPSRQGYAFELPSRKYSDVTRGVVNQNYVAGILTYTVSGTVTSGGRPLAGVVMNGLPGNPATNDNGYYSAVVNYGWSSIVTPTQNGYNFEPVNITHKPVFDHKTQNYSAILMTYTVSGSVGMAGAVMEGLPGEPISDVSGYYSAVVGYGWNGTVTPKKRGYSFGPVNRIYNSVTQDQEHSYSPEKLTYILSGRIAARQSPVSGVVMEGLPSEPTTDKDGSYSVVVDYGWTGNAAPAKQGCVFKPAEKLYADVSADQVQNYDAELLTYAISGSVTSNDKPVSGVSLVASDGTGATTTNNFGRYELKVNYGWSGAVTIAKKGYTFEQGKQRYTNVTADTSDQNYNAELVKCSINGKIIIGGQPIEGVLISADNGGTSVMTNSKGKYSVIVDYGWSGSVTPTKQGYLFSPPSQRYVNVISDITDDDSQQNRDSAAKAAAAREAAAKEAVAREAAAREAAVRQDQLAIEQEINELEIVPQVEPLQLPPRPLQEKAQQSYSEFIEPELSDEALISNVFIDTELRQVLQDIASQADVTIIPDQTVTGLISCELRDVSLEKALEIVLAGTGYVTKKTPDYYLVSSPNPKDAAFTSSSQTVSVKLNYIKAEVAEKLLSPVFKNYVQANTDTGTIVITAPQPLIDRIESDLRKIDKAPRHVMLDARVVVMQNSDLLNLGIKWGWPQIQAGIFSNSALHSGSPPAGGSWPWGIQIGYATGATFTNALTLSLDLLEKNGEATIVSSPQVMAQDGKEAEIRITTEEYFSLVPKVTSGSSYYYNRSELEKIEYGTILNIIPHIGENGDITLEMKIEVSDVALRTDDYPVVTRRIVKNTMRIQDGGTVTVAGLKKSETYKDYQKVPGASGIPLIGGLFKDKSEKSTSQQVAIFVTARLIPNIELRSGSTTMQSEQEKVLKSKKELDAEFREALEESLFAE